MSGKKKTEGPFNVIPVQVEGREMYEVIEVRPSGRRMSLRPRYFSRTRQSAYSKMLTLNRKWQREHQGEHQEKENNTMEEQKANGSQTATAQEER